MGAFDCTEVACRLEVLHGPTKEGAPPDHTRHRELRLGGSCKPPLLSRRRFSHARLSSTPEKIGTQNISFSVLRR